ncbi:MAG: hypothetical protein VX527_07450, partial [Planctomycetota bacterium]|nr:hypothetical protein [Planctomycetota bacterium]
ICQETPEDDCAYWGGKWLGEDTLCETSDCYISCFGDADSSGAVDVNDILITIGEYGTICP